MSDVDIDTAPDFKPENYFKKWVRAAVVKDGKVQPHPVGVYPQAMARDPFTGLAAVPYEEAEELGYLKVDFLHLNAYQRFESRQEIEQLLKKEPNWGLLQMPSTWDKLFQLAKHGDLLQKVKPRSIEELADCMALIRPGKKGLLGLYLKERDACRKILFAQDESGYSFKRSHSLAYSLVVVLQLHLIEQGRL